MCHGKIFNNTFDEKTLKFNNKMCQGKIFNKTSSSSTQTFNKNFIMFISIDIMDS